MTCYFPKLLTLTALAFIPTLGLRAQPGMKPKKRQVVMPPPNKEKFQLYLLVGQSNMAGRGNVEAQDTVPNRHILALNKNNQWEIAKDPIHFDKPVAGVGPGLPFGRIMAAQDTSITIGLIPCAVGGTAISFWKRGAYNPDSKTKPYDVSYVRAQDAMKAGTLAGILWNQGEADTSPEKSMEYQKNLVTVIEQFRTDLQAPDVPFVAALLPDFQVNRVSATGEETVSVSATRVNAAIETVKQMLPNYAFVVGSGTKDRGDKIHYDAPSARLLGQRYAEAMLKIQKKQKSKRKK